MGKGHMGAFFSMMTGSSGAGALSPFVGANPWPAADSSEVVAAFNSYSQDLAGLKQLLCDLFTDVDSASSEECSRVAEEIAKAAGGKGDSVDLSAVREKLWATFFKHMLSPKTALVVIDVQNDFIDGSLGLKFSPAKEDGNDVLPVINAVRQSTQFDLTALTIDWHPKDHCSFASNFSKYGGGKVYKEAPRDANPFEVVNYVKPDGMTQVLWPDHCVQGSSGADLHKDLIVRDTDFQVKKGLNSLVDSYSGFRDNEPEALNSQCGASVICKGELGQVLVKNDAEEVYCCGLATDFCVVSTTMHALQSGFSTVIIRDGCRGVAPDSIADADKRMREAGVIFVESKDVPQLAARNLRPVQLALSYFKNAGWRKQLVAYRSSL